MFSFFIYIDYLVKSITLVKISPYFSIAVSPLFTKKLSIQLNIHDLEQSFIENLNSIFRANEGENQVGFEVVETELVKTITEVIPEKAMVSVESTDEIDIDNLDVENAVEDDLVDETPSSSETIEVKKITSLEMKPRKLKVKISKELLQELDKMQVNFRFN